MRVESHGGARRLQPEGPAQAEGVRRLVPATEGAVRESFERAIRARRFVDARAILREIQDATQPHLEDASILGNARSMEILEYLIDEVLPFLGHDQDTAAVLARLLGEELQQQGELLLLMQPEVEVEHGAL
ncbi:hypothetical protein [Pseudomonas sp. LRF_L74]|uniref:hypothetical protein n=1 Tax=Pseudomonas sp. LRF_L74 TaxID=3369422 RepID=UPI003F606813